MYTIGIHNHRVYYPYKAKAWNKCSVNERVRKKRGMRKLILCIAWLPWVDTIICVHVKSVISGSFEDSFHIYCH